MLGDGQGTAKVDRLPLALHTLSQCTANRLPGFVLATSIDYMLQLCEQRGITVCV